VEQKTAELMAGAVMDLLEDVNVSISDLAEALLGTPIPKKYKQLVRQSSKVGLAQALRSRPEPTPEQVKEILAKFEMLKKTPQLMRPLLRKAIKDIPRSKSGPKNKLTAEQKMLACGEIMLRRSEYSDREAVQQVARKYNVSERTMYRIWSKQRARKKTKTSA
jgi:hypothetical protein